MTEAMRVGNSQLVDVEVGQETQSDRRWLWRWVTVAITVLLCVAATVLLTRYMQDPDQSQGGSDLQHKLRQLAGTDKAAIHLEGEYNRITSPNSVLWSKNSGHAFAQGGLELEDNKIIIPRSGLYFVYSQASFRVSCEAKAGDKDTGTVVHISHLVERFSDSYGGIWKDLVSSTRATCRKVEGGPHSAKHWHNGIYLGAVFSLQEGDELRTYTKEEALPSLEWQHGKTFFGAFAL